jgi:hypothetical protein
MGRLIFADGGLVGSPLGRARMFFLQVRVNCSQTAGSVEEGLPRPGHQKGVESVRSSHLASERDLRRRLGLFAAALVVIGACAGSASAGKSRTADVVAVPGLSRFALGTDGFRDPSTLPRYSYVILGTGENQLVGHIHKASPRTKVLGFESASEAVSTCSPKDPGSCQSPITYAAAVAHDAKNPNDPWLLYAKDKQSLTMPDYKDAHLTNVGSTSYQKLWLANTEKTLRARHFDGVYIDSVLGYITFLKTPPPLYPTDAAWEKATKSFVAYVGPRLKKAGFYVLANTFKGGDNDGAKDVAWWSSLAPYVSGLQSEYWEETPSSTNRRPFNDNPCCWTGHWQSWLNLAEAAQKHGADFFTVDKSTATNTKLMTYLRGSYLLVWDGKGGGFTLAHEPVDTREVWNPAWTITIGKPMGNRFQVGLAWRRNYSGGTVVVNPDWKKTQTVSLGHQYATPDGKDVTSITLAPDSAAILTAAN